MASRLICNDKNHGGQVKPPFLSDIKKAHSVEIAVGYIGESFIKGITPALKKIAQQGGKVRLLVGMVFHKGISKKQAEALKTLNQAIKNSTPENGVYISRKEYHGKLYLIKKPDSDTLYIGSSNLSQQGFFDRLEATARIQSEPLLTQSTNYINHLFKLPTTTSIEKVSLTRLSTTKPSRQYTDYSIDCSEAPSENQVIGICKILLRVDVQPNSALNLYFDKGRLNKKGLYAPRPWYEVEIGATTKDTITPYYPPSQKKQNSKKARNGKFTAYIKEDGKCYKIKMVVSADGGKNIASAKESGGRETLGSYIKGKLEDAGILKYGERITSDMLEAYGNEYFILKKISDDKYIIEF